MKHTIDDLFENPTEVFEFTGKYGDNYKRYNVTRDRLNKMFGCKLKCVFSKYPSSVDEKSVEFETGVTFLVNHKNEVLRLTNSEWASVVVVNNRDEC